MFVLGLGTPQVISFSISSSGALVSPIIAGSAGASPIAMALDPVAPFAYVANSTNGIGTGGISQYVRKNGGALTIASVTATNGTVQTVPPAPAGVNPVALVVNDTGTLVFVANKGSDQISVYMLDSVNGVLTPPGCVEGQSCTPQICPPNPTSDCAFWPTGTGTAPSAVATTGSSLFVAFSGTSQIATYSFDSKGVLTLGSTISSDPNPIAMQLDPTGKFLFVLASPSPTAPGSVQAFSVGSSGVLSAVGSPVATGTNAFRLHVHPAGKFLYVSNAGSDNVSGYSINAGALTPLSGSPFAAGPSPTGISIDASGAFLFVGNLTVNTISVFSIDSSGALKEVSGSPFPSVASQPVSLTNLN